MDGPITNPPEKQPGARNWQSLLIVGLGVGLGVTFARTAPAQWLGFNDYWAAFAVELAAAALAGGIVASVLRVVFKFFGSGK